MKNVAIAGELRTHHKLLKRLARAMDEKDFSLMVIFPTLSLLKNIQEELLNQPGINGIGGFRLLLFEGFIGELRERLGLNGHLPTNQERDFILTQVYQELDSAGCFGYLNRIPFTLNYRQAVLDGIAEWKRSSLTSELFLEWAGDQSEKEQELALLYAAYQKKLLIYGFIEDDLTLTELQLMRMSGTSFSGTTKVILYGFTDLTPLQTDFIKALEPWFEFEAVVDPTAVPEFQNFTQRFFPFKTISTRESSYKGTLGESALNRLQAKVWSDDPQTFTINPEDHSLQLIQAAGPRQAVGIARAICGLLQSGSQYDWDDFLILAPSPQQFIKEADPVFKEYQLRLSGKEAPLKETALVNCFLRTLRVVLEGWQWAELKGLIHHAYKGLTAQEGDRLLLILAEKYGALSGRDRWLKILESSDFKLLLQDNSIQVEPLQQLCEELQSIPEEESYRWYLLFAKSWFEAQGRFQPGQIDRPFLWKEIQSYEAAQWLIAAISTLLELDQDLTKIDEFVNLEQFKMFFEEHLLNENLIEKVANGIRVISPREVRGLRVKVIFITGLEQGRFPRNYVNDWKLSPSARFDLKTLGVELEMGENYQIQEKFSFYWAIQAASEVLYFVYQDQDTDGQLTNRSPFLNDVLTHFPELPDRMPIYHLEPQVCKAFDECHSEFETRQLWVADSLIPAPSLSQSELLKYQQLASNSNYLRLAWEIDYWLKYRRPNFNRFLADNQKLCKMIESHFNEEREIGITALEDYLICPYRFFLKHFLQIRILPEASLLPEAMELGNFYHQILAAFLNNYRGQALTREKIPEYHQLLEALLREKLAEWKEAAANDIVRAVLAAEEEGIHRTLRRWLAEELKWSDLTGSRFFPYLTECAFGDSTTSGALPGFTINNNEIKVIISGRVDRIDKDSQGNFVVYDYKLGHGPTTGDLKNLKKIQIPAYLLALEQLIFVKGKAVGGAYLGLKDPSRSSGGIWHEERLSISWRSQSGLEDSQWEEWLQNLEKVLLEAARGIRGAHFELTKDQCPEYCEYKSCCRRQEREVEMSGAYSE